MRNYVTRFACVRRFSRSPFWEHPALEREAEHVVEQAIIQSISEHMSHSSGGESSGSDGGH